MDGGEPLPADAGTISGRRASLTALAGVLGAVALMLLLVTWAATIGPEKVVRGVGNPRTDFTVPSPTLTQASDPPGATVPQGGGDIDILYAVVTLVVVLLAAVVMLAVVLWVLYWLLTRDWTRRRREAEPEEVAFDPLEAPGLVAEAMVVDAAAQREVLMAGGSPRNAIVACWHRFEEQAAAAGVRRQAWETSSEFTLRILDRLSANSESVLVLADLYRAARHSSHEITEDDRSRAEVALDVVHRSLGVTSVSGGRGPA